MDERSPAQYHIDFRTGVSSAVQGSYDCAQQRSACIAINRIRARGLLEADPFHASGESLSIDVWETAFARVAREWQLPLISLEKLGIFHDADGFRSSSPEMIPMTPGAEACPYYDTLNQVVYKLFDLRADGSLGKKLSYSLNSEGEFELSHRSARLRDTVEKIAVLNEIGAHPTEIVGLSEDGGYLIVKQPLANRSDNFESDRKVAIEHIRGVLPTRSGLRTVVCIAWHNEQTWMVGDLHERNIMRDGDGKPTIIDALIGPVSPLAMRQLRWIQEATEDAIALRKGQPLPERKLFYDTDDSEL